MIRISIDNKEDAGLLDTFAASLHRAGYTTAPLPGGAAMSTLVAEQRSSVLVLGTPKNGTPLAIGKAAANAQAPWLLNSPQLELLAPNGTPIQLSHSESCILQAAAHADGQLLGRKTLIEALGQNFMHYDERRLEALISRLRRKLASYVPDGFPIRAVRGHGYLFGAALQESASGT